MSDNGFNQDGSKIEGFTASCDKCASPNVAVEYEFNYYGGMTGWDISLIIKCEECENYADLSV